MITRMEILKAASDGDDAKEKIYDTICEAWYLDDEDDDTKALKKFKADLASVEKKIKG
ncbi:hypothetical protein D3C87_1179140 [compost metagenome]